MGMNPLTGEKAGGVFVRSDSTYSDDFKTRHDSGCTTISGDSTDKVCPVLFLEFFLDVGEERFKGIFTVCSQLLQKQKKTKSRFETEDNTSGCSSGKDIESEQNADKHRISGDSGAEMDTVSSLLLWHNFIHFIHYHICVLAATSSVVELSF